jgi:hypothetical protein
MSFQDLFVFRVCLDKSAVILMVLPLHVTCAFSFEAFYMLSVLIMICLGCFFFGPDGLVFYKLPVPE